jgi:quinol monooxygenase YgiN
MTAIHNKETSMIYVIAEIKIKAGSLEAIKKAVAPCLEGTRKEAGCVYYNLNVNVFDNETLTFTECWETREALTKHFTQPHMLAWRAAGAEHILSRKIEIIHSKEVEKL